MLWNAKNGTVKIGDSDMDYISFGTGNENLIILPGLGDGLKTVKGTALPFAAAYKIFARDFRVYVFSRKNRLEEGYSTKDMARDQAEAMQKLGITNAHIIGVSQGGMIAQYVAIDYPHLVNRLVLAVTLARQNETIQNAVRGWIAMAKSGDGKRIIIDTAEKSYTEKYLKKYRLFYPLLGIMKRDTDFRRFLIQAESCIHHNAYNELDKIECPVFVIGGGTDNITGPSSSRETALKIKNSRLLIYEGLGHGAYEEAKDFNIRVLNFLNSKK